MINVIAIDDCEKILSKLEDISNSISGGGSGGAGVNYSTSEINTGIKYIDNKPVYQKTIVLNNATNGTVLATGVEHVIECSGYVTDSSGTEVCIPYAVSTTSAGVWKDNTDSAIFICSSAYNNRKAEITIKYTKL